jgi:hypothetical protein
LVLHLYGDGLVGPHDCAGNVIHAHALFLLYLFLLKFILLLLFFDVFLNIYDFILLLCVYSHFRYDDALKIYTEWLFGYRRKKEQDFDWEF